MSINIPMNPLNNELSRDIAQDIETGSSHMQQPALSKSRLLDVLVKNQGVLTILKATWNYWPSENTPNYQLRRALFVFGLGVMVAASGCALFVAIFAWTNHYEFGIIFNFAKFLSFISVFPAQYYNQMRLQQPAHMLEDSVGLDSAYRVVTWFGLAAAVSAVLSFALSVPLYDGKSVYFVYLYLFVAEVVTAMYLTFNLLFILMDVNVSKQLLDQMSIQAESKSLTLDSFNFARDEIHRRVELSKWATDIIVVPCVMATITIVIVIGYLDRGVNDVKVQLSVAFIVTLLKELLFVAIAFYYVAQVNERADALTVKLSAREWYPGTEVQHKADAQRISICTTSIVQPISFTLMFKRLSWRDVAVSAGGLGVSLFVAILKSSI